MQKAGNISTVLAFNQQYTVPSGQLAEITLTGSGALAYINTTTTSAVNRLEFNTDGVQATNYRVSLGNGNYIRLNSISNNIGIAGYRLSN